MESHKMNECVGFKLRKNIKNEPVGSCIGCRYLDEGSQWDNEEYVCNRSDNDLPYEPDIKPWIPYPMTREEIDE